MSTSSTRRSHIANAAVSYGHLVVLSTNGGVDLNGASTKPDGIALTDTAASGYVAVRYMHETGSAVGKSAVSVIALGGTLYAGASGTISATGTIVVGKALEACSVTGAEVEYIPNTL